MEKVVVTGATGFIGRQTIPFLQRQGFDIHAITSKNNKEELRDDITWHSLDIFDNSKVADFCRKLGAGSLLHLAWHDAPKGRMTSPMNLAWVGASLHLVHAFVENGGDRVVLAGSCAEYDWRHGYCSEGVTPIEPGSLYGECKASLHRIVATYCRDKRIRYSNGRIFFVYGPHEAGERLVAYAIRSLLMDRKAELSHGNQIRDYLHVTDVAGALVTLLISDVEGPVNIASGQPRRLREIIDAIGQKLQKSELISYSSRDGARDKAPVVFADVSRLRDEVGWTPQYELENGIDATINWWKDSKQLMLNV